MTAASNKIHQSDRIEKKFDSIVPADGIIEKGKKKAFSPLPFPVIGQLPSNRITTNYLSIPADRFPKISFRSGGNRFSYPKIPPPPPETRPPRNSRESSSRFSSSSPLICPLRLAPKSLDSHSSAADFISPGERPPLPSSLPRSSCASSSFERGTKPKRGRRRRRRKKRRVEAAIHFISRVRCRQPN